MSINFKEIVLDNYGGFKLRANVDENPEDIIAAVLYCDHGDSFLVVKTRDSINEYGLWFTRDGYPDLNVVMADENHYERKYFEKLPILTGPIDHRSGITNEIFFLIRDNMMDRGGFIRQDKIKKCYRKQEAQITFNYVYSELKKRYETGIVYHCSSSSYLNDILEFVNINDILTEDNQKLIEDLKMFLRIDTIDGDAGKKNLNMDHVVYADDISWIYYNGKMITKKYHKHGIKVKGYWEDERDFGPTYRCSVNMAQFV